MADERDHAHADADSLRDVGVRVRPFPASRNPARTRRHASFLPARLEIIWSTPITTEITAQGGFGRSEGLVLDAAAVAPDGTVMLLGVSQRWVSTLISIVIC